MKLKMDTFKERHGKILEEFRTQINRDATKHSRKILENFRIPTRGDRMTENGELPRLDYTWKREAMKEGATSKNPGRWFG